MDIRLVVAEKPGHWISDPSTVAGLPAAERPFGFMAVDLDNSLALVDNLVAAVQKREVESGIRIDGIVTVQDDYLVSVCQAAMKLGLPTCGTPEAYQNCLDKFKMRSLLPWNGQIARLIRTRDDIATALAGGLEFPVIIKPQSGGGSRE